MVLSTLTYSRHRRPIVSRLGAVDHVVKVVLEAVIVDRDCWDMTRNHGRSGRGSTSRGRRSAKRSARGHGSSSSCSSDGWRLRYLYFGAAGSLQRRRGRSNSSRCRPCKSLSPSLRCRGIPLSRTCCCLYPSSLNRPFPPPPARHPLNAQHPPAQTPRHLESTHYSALQLLTTERRRSNGPGKHVKRNRPSRLTPFDPDPGLSCRGMTR